MRRVSSDGERDPRRRMPALAPRVARFPGPVAIAVDVPQGCIALFGLEDRDGRPWSVQVRYRDPADARRRVVVRTTRGSLDWRPVIGTVENLDTVMRNCGARPIEPVIEEPATVEIDGEVVSGVRVACHEDDCAMAFDWQGQHVYIVGVTELADSLRLRRGSVDDFAAYEAAHRARHGLPGQ